MPAELQDMSNGDLIYMLLLCFGGGIGLTISLHTIFRYGLSAIAIRPIVPFALFFSVVHFFTPLVKSFENVYRYQEDYSLF